MIKELNKFRFLVVGVFILLFFSCAEFKTTQDPESESEPSEELIPSLDVVDLEGNEEIVVFTDPIEMADTEIEVDEPELGVSPNEIQSFENDIESIASERDEVSMDEEWQLSAGSDSEVSSVLALCEEIGDTLGSVDEDDCLEQDLRFAGTYTSHNRPIAVRDYIPEGSLTNKTKILIMGGIHGDEYSSVSIMFKWMALLNESPSSDLIWRFVPTVNPDGLLGGTAIRQNGNGVDLNRNFPSADWDEQAHQYWQDSTGSNPRRYPGESAASELEVQWIVEQIKAFEPDVIMSVHAPYHLLDFDGPTKPPERIGELYLHVLGVYPGSLGNYAGINLEIPVVTLELPSAGIMPTKNQIDSMWADTQNWLIENF